MSDERTPLQDAEEKMWLDTVGGIRPGTRPPMPMSWRDLRIAFAHSAFTISQFADRYTVNVKTLENRVLSNKWMRLRKDVQHKVEALAALEIQKERAKELAAFNKADLNLARAIRGMVAHRIQHMSDLRKAKPDDYDVINPAELRTLAGTVETTQRVGRLALGAATSTQELTGKDGAPLGVGKAPTIVIGGPPEDGEPVDLIALEYDARDTSDLDDGDTTNEAIEGQDLTLDDDVGTE